MKTHIRVIPYKVIKVFLFVLNYCKDTDVHDIGCIDDEKSDQPFAALYALTEAAGT